MADSDILIEILKSKEKLWSDKKRLGILTENRRQEMNSLLDTQHSPNDWQDEKTRLAEQLSCGSPGFGRKLPHKETPKHPVTLPEDVRGRKKAELISKLIEPAPPTDSEWKQETTKYCVTLPDDLRAKKKAEFISNLSETQESFDLKEREELVSPTSMVRFGEYSPLNPGILSPGKTLLGLGDWEEKRRQILERKKKEYMENMSHARQAAIQQPQTYDLAIHSTMLKISTGTQTDLMITGYIAESSASTASSVCSPVIAVPPSNDIHITTSTQTAGGPVQHVVERSASPFLPLSPRERKLVETYSPSFLTNHTVLDGFSSPQGEEQLSEIARRKREAYQEELKQQIEEKRQIEAERLERDRREEEAIARRAEQQRERMIQEYEMEEARRRERKLQRLRQAEEFQRRQEELRLQEELEREVQARRRLEKRLADLEAGLNSHTSLQSFSSRRLEDSLPIHTLKPELNSREAAIPITHTPLQETYRTHESLPLEQNPQQGSTAPVTTLSYHRPPTEIIRAAGYTYELHKPDILSAPETAGISNNSASKSADKPAPVKLDDSLPIPVLRAPSPVIPSSRRKSASESSEAMRRLEAKWEVPAVEKNVVFGNNPNNILTQLGAVRHRMQLEQQRMEEYLKQKS